MLIVLDVGGVAKGAGKAAANHSALAASLDKAERRRVLAGAETSASPALRAALTAIATNDDDVAARLGSLTSR